MSLSLGKAFDRSYDLRIPFNDGFYNIGVFFNKKSNFLLFSVNQDNHITPSSLAKIKMFKNLESSLFCETFIELHNFRKTNLDISNQFNKIKPEYYSDVNVFINETINLNKYNIDNKSLFDKLTIYALTFTSYMNEFVFIIAERQYINRKLNKKIVRSTAVQLATSHTLSVIDEFNTEMLESKRSKINMQDVTLKDETITME